MQFISPTYTILSPDFSKYPDAEKDLCKMIELAARTCYKSTDKIMEGSAEKICKNLIARGHEAMLEHASITVLFTVDRGITHEAVRHRMASFAQESSRYCVAGDMQLKTSNVHNRPTVKELYDNIQNSRNGAYNRMRIKQLNEDSGQFEFAHIKNVYYTGIKPVYTLVTELGYTLTCTKDHQIYTPNGYVKLDDLKVGDLVYVNGTPIDGGELYKNKDWLYHQNITLNKTFVQIAREFSFNVNTLKKWAAKLGIPQIGTGYFKIGSVPWNKGLKEDDDHRVKKQANTLRKYHCNGRHDGEKILLKEENVNYQKHIGDKCEICGKKDKLEVHHKDKNRLNNNKLNLKTLCKKCHARVHSQNLEVPYADKIVCIKEKGCEPVYDVEMDSPNHNFIANGVVVHNCNYSKEKFGSNIRYIDLRPALEIDPVTSKLGKIPKDAIIQEWMDACRDAEFHYLRMIELGCTPQIARAALNNSTASELVVTANIREWRHILSLRAVGTTGKPHPQMEEIMVPLLRDLATHLPSLFADTYVAYMKAHHENQKGENK